MRASRRHPSARDEFRSPAAGHSSEHAPDRRAPGGAAPALRALAPVIAALLLLSPADARADGLNTTKAEMLWNIAKFIQWPEAALIQSRGQIVFTILGEDDLAAELANVLSTKTIAGKPVFVRFARRAQDARGSEILYVAASEADHMDAVLAVVADSPVLTVADTPAFAARGGMVGFAGDSTKVRFEINLGHAERNGLRISAKLLALARVVDSGP